MSSQRSWFTTSTPPARQHNRWAGASPQEYLVLWQRRPDIVDLMWFSSFMVFAFFLFAGSHPLDIIFLSSCIYRWGEEAATYSSEASGNKMNNNSKEKFSYYYLTHKQTDRHTRARTHACTRTCTYESTHAILLQLCKHVHLLYHVFSKLSSNTF